MRKMYHENTRKSNVAILISEILDVKAKIITRDIL